MTDSAVAEPKEKGYNSKKKSFRTGGKSHAAAAVSYTHLDVYKRQILDVELADNTKAHVLKPDGEYEKIDRRGKVLVNSQKQFCEEAVAAVPKTDHVYRERVFVPAEPAE